MSGCRHQVTLLPRHARRLEGLVRRGQSASMEIRVAIRELLLHEHPGAGGVGSRLDELRAEYARRDDHSMLLTDQELEAAAAAIEGARDGDNGTTLRNIYLSPGELAVLRAMPDPFERQAAVVARALDLRWSN